MRYSHEVEEQEMAKELMMGHELTGEMKRIFDSYSDSYYTRSFSPKKEQSTDDAKKEQSTDDAKKEQSTDDSDQSMIEKISARQQRVNDKQFTENVLMAMLKTLRNLGLARDAYVDWLRYKSKRIEDEKTTLTEASSFTDISTDGLLPKILSFGGGGSGVTAVLTSSAATDNYLDKSLNYFSQLGEITVTNTNNASLQTALNGVAKNIVELSNKATQAPPQAPLFGLPIEQLIPIFVVAGVGMLAAVTFILKIWKNRRTRVLDDDFARDVQEHWRKTTRPSMADCLFDLYKDLQFTMSLFYPKYREVGFLTTHDPMEAIKTDDKTARRIIEEEIIQPESVEPSNIPFLVNNEHKEEDNDYKRRKERAEEEWEKLRQQQKKASDTERGSERRRIKEYEAGEVESGEGGGAGEEGDLE